MTACKADLQNSPVVARKTLEVIVTSVEDALEAKRGGADRLEVVRSLDQGGLTPPVALLEQIMARVDLPIRAMLRESPSMSVSSEREMQCLIAAAKELCLLPIEGLVLGFVRDGYVDVGALKNILPSAPTAKITFHRAFEDLRAPLAALDTLKSFPQIDRILVRASRNGHYATIDEVKAWQHFADPQIRFIVGIGLERELLPALLQYPELSDIHVGRTARDPETNSGVVSPSKIAGLKRALL